MENFTSLKPINPFLKNYIETFYFHKSSRKESKKIVFFPNTKNALTIYKDVNYMFDPKRHYMKVTKSNKANYTCFYLGIQKSYTISEIETPFDKIGIIFKPLGLNFFLDKQLSQIKSPENIEFKYFEKELNPILKKVYHETDLHKRLELLESFFIHQFKENDDLKTLHLAISLIENGGEKKKIKQIALELKISSKALTRKFKKHINCTPKHYSNVYFFRKALEEYEREKKQKKLTSIAFNNNYFDQSDFIKFFKRYTGLKPTNFFKEVNDFGNEIFWLSN